MSRTYADFKAVSEQRLLELLRIYRNCARDPNHFAHNAVFRAYFVRDLKTVKFELMLRGIDRPRMVRKMSTSHQRASVELAPQKRSWVQLWLDL
jgi:hypothetical protein